MCISQASLAFAGPTAVLGRAPPCNAPRSHFPAPVPTFQKGWQGVFGNRPISEKLNPPLRPFRRQQALQAGPAAAKPCGGLAVGRSRGQHSLCISHARSTPGGNQLPPSPPGCQGSGCGAGKSPSALSFPSSPRTRRLSARAAAPRHPLPRPAALLPPPGAGGIAQKCCHRAGERGHNEGEKGKAASGRPLLPPGARGVSGAAAPGLAACCSRFCAHLAPPRCSQAISLDTDGTGSSGISTRQRLQA